MSSKFNKLPLAALVLVSAATFNSPKVEARSSQNLTQQPPSNIIGLTQILLILGVLGVLAVQ